MMMRWFRSGAGPRGAPAFRRSTGRHPVVFLVLAIGALSQAGCACWPCNGCSGFGSRVKNLSERAFRPIRNLVTPGPGGCSTCGGGGALGVEAAPVMPYGGSMIVAPGSTTLAPSGTSPSGPTDSTITPDLTPIPGAIPGPPPEKDTGSTGAKGGTTKSSYEAFRPKYNTGAGSDRTRASGLARTLESNPVPTTRSAQGSSTSNTKPSPGSGMEPNPLDNLPPIDVPADLSRRQSTPPAPNSVALDAESATDATPRSLAAKAAAMTPATVSLAPGIRRFVGVESKLAGGSLPDAAGLNWLQEKGFKTILDLREDSDLAPGFVSDVARRGLRYVALPIRAKSIDAELVSRFELEITITEGRPLYFCDSDGTRAGAMWLIHRVIVDKVDPLVARRDAEDLGLFDTGFLRAAETYLDRVKPDAPAQTTPPASKPATPSATPSADPKTLPSKNPRESTGATSNTPAPPSAGPSPSTLIDGEGSKAISRDLMSWRPLALVTTGLGIPIAFMSRNAILSNLRSFTRASLPGPGSRWKSLPPASGVET